MIRFRFFDTYFSLLSLPKHRATSCDVSLAMDGGRKPKFDKECMGYYVSRNETDARKRAFWAGYNRAKTKNHFKAGELAGRVSAFWSILRYAQIVIVVAAMFIVLRGYVVLVTLP